VISYIFYSCIRRVPNERAPWPALGSERRFFGHSDYLTFMYAPINYFNIHSCTEAALASQTTITNPHKRMDRGKIQYQLDLPTRRYLFLYPLHVTQQSELSFHEIIERLEPRPNCNQ